MRITILNQYYRPDIAPTAYLAASLAEGLASKDHQVTVVASKGGYVQPETRRQQENHDNPRVYRIWTPMLGKKSILQRCLDYLSYYILGLFRVLFLPRQDVIISLTTPPYLVWVALAHRLLRRRRTRVILWNMDCYPEAAERAGKLKTNGIASRIMRWGNRAVFKRIDHLVTLDTAMSDLLMQQYAPTKNPPKCTVIPNWEEASYFPPDVEAPVWEGVERLGLADQFVVLYLGNMGEGHQFDTVIEAAKKLLGQAIIFLFIGGGAKVPLVEKAKAEYGLDNVILHPYVPKEVTDQVMSACDCALITLRDDMLGVMSPSKLHSNLALGLPILYVGPETSNVDDAISDFNCGISIRHGQADEVVQFIQQLSTNPDQHRLMRERARDAFDKQYNDTQTLPQFERIIHAL
ncbi:MAG: glycosyltransferase family 4 protein [Planctomycetota bacterium]